MFNNLYFRKHNYIITDLDKSWSNGIAFCALINYFCPALMNMHQIQTAIVNSRERLELAFEIARLHLNIRYCKRDLNNFNKNFKAINRC